MARTPYSDPDAEAAYQDMADNTSKVAGDVEPIRPAGSPANNAGAMGQKSNQRQQNPNLDDPKNSNIKRIYG